jgi:UDP-N-acetylmuramoyl-L-alanyl-D-glutamate--2,6-diaminopimelate ligase
MKNISDILKYIQPIEIVGEIPSYHINKIYIDSKQVMPNSLFIAVKGTNVDGHNYIEDAIKNGAKFIVCEQIPSDRRSEVLYIKVENTQNIAGRIAATYFDFPSDHLKVVGVTGTNGKTTIATLLYRLFRYMGEKVGLLSTVVNYVDSKMYKSTHTTPDPIELQRLLSKMVEAGCTYCFMEVSSHAIVQHRIESVTFSGGVFTNLTHDHLDYHKTFDEYLKAKKKFFDDLPENAFALTNIDDKNGNVMLQNTNASVHTYALKTLADFHLKILEYHLNGTLIKLDNKEVWIKLIGEFNAYNMLAIYATAVLLDKDKEKILTDMSLLTAVDGRFEYMNAPKGYTAIIDYAHTPDAIAKVLTTINNLKKENSRIITVVGAGGNRDKTKRPIMAKEAALLSDKLILTSDNPRFEKPEDILNDMKQGLNDEDMEKTLTIVDRKEAIRTALMLAQKNDIIFIAGKGHETYQEIEGVKHPFSDVQVVKELINIK